MQHFFQSSRVVSKWVFSPMLFGILILFALGCSPADSSSEDAASSESAIPATAVKVVNVEATHVKLSDFWDYIHVTGEVEADRDVIVTSEESGVIKEFYVHKGMMLRRGQSIAKLKDDVLVSQLAEAQAAATLAREQFKRQKVLWQRDKIGSELAYIQAKSGADAANARVNLLKTRLSNTTVKAPIAGIFDEQFLEAGEMATPGQPFIRQINTDRVRIAAGIPERYAQFVQPGDSAWITFDILPGEVYAGAISFVGSSVDEGSRTFPVEVVLNNPNRHIKPHMVASLDMVKEQLYDVITVPRQILLRQAEGYQVYVAQEFQGSLVAALRWVRLGPAYQGQVVVHDGLTEGELLITLGYQQVDHGTPVRLTNASSLVLAGDEE